MHGTDLRLFWPKAFPPTHTSRASDLAAVGTALTSLAMTCFGRVSNPSLSQQRADTLRAMPSLGCIRLI